MSNGEMNHQPAAMTQDELVAMLEDLLGGVKTGDTLEGFVEFLVGDDPNKWDVRARYRVGNTMGQGGMRIVGRIR